MHWQKTRKNTLITVSKLQLARLKSKKSLAKHEKFAHFETLRKRFDEIIPFNDPYIWLQN